ncbi:hypothetical protein GOV14_06830 [Candidatus Pacearchaeota archaeon]|nr:hypothetical protein [Candidatus Pacearchaeota archaeon]
MIITLNPEKDDIPQTNSIDQEQALEIFEKICYTRAFEKQVKKSYDTHDIKCPVYLSVGQEAASATISTFFKPDLIFTQHRGHAYYLSFGGDKDKIVDELLGRDSGCNRGRGGSPGVQDLNIGMIGHHGLIGENVPLAVGAAVGDTTKKVLCVFGDGAAEEDYIFTAMAFAQTHKLQVLFVCEDNDLSILTKKHVRRNWELSDALKAIGMPAVDIPDDPELIAKYVNEFKHKLPAFINCRTCRHLWHVGTGQDGTPRIDRLKEYKQKLIQMGSSSYKLQEIEDQKLQEAETLWRRHLERQ